MTSEFGNKDSLRVHSEILIKAPDVNTKKNAVLSFVSPHSGALANIV